MVVLLAGALGLVGCKKGAGADTDGGLDGGEDACDLSTEPGFDGGVGIPWSGAILPNFFDIWGTAPDNLYAVGSSGLVMHWDGSSWTQETVPAVGDLLGIWGSAADDIFAVGQGGAILHFDGTAWTQQQTPLGDGGIPLVPDLHGVSGGARGDAWAVGLDATVMHTTDGVTWTKVTVPTQETLNGIWIAPGGGGGVAVGNLGTILEYDGSGWTRRRISGLTAHLKGAWGWNTSNVFVVGLNGTLVSNQGGTWQRLNPETKQPRDIECQQGPAPWPNVYLRDAWGGGGRLFLVGWSGTIMIGENNIATVYQVTENRLEAIWGTLVIDTPGQGDGGIPDGGLETHYEAVIVGVTGAVIRVRFP
jgi:hypothetical protein